MVGSYCNDNKPTVITSTNSKLFLAWQRGTASNKFLATWKKVASRHSLKKKDTLWEWEDISSLWCLTVCLQLSAVPQSPSRRPAAPPRTSPASSVLDSPCFTLLHCTEQGSTPTPAGTTSTTVRSTAPAQTTSPSRPSTRGSCPVGLAAAQPLVGHNQSSTYQKSLKCRDQSGRRKWDDLLLRGSKVSHSSHHLGAF